MSIIEPIYSWKKIDKNKTKTKKDKPPFFLLLCLHKRNYRARNNLYSNSLALPK